MAAAGISVVGIVATALNLGRISPDWAKTLSI